LVPVSLAAGFIRGFAGFGGPLVMLPILNQFLVPAASMWVMMWVDLLVNVRLLPEARKEASRPVLLPLVAGTIVAMPVGVKLMAGSDPASMKRVIGAAVLVAALLLLSGWRYSGNPRSATWIGAGLLSGVVMGATSLAVTVALFLSADRQSVAQSRANFIVWVFIATVALLILLVAQGALQTGYLEMICVLAPLYLIGTVAGAYFQGRAPEHLVRRFVLLLAATIGGAGAIL
jgi:uncharacterized membrane protein YfcA